MSRVLVAAVLALALQVAGSNVSDPDWQLRLVGIPLASPQSTRFHHLVNSTLPREQSIVLALTEQDVLASLDPITGSLHWRHRLPGTAAATTLHTCDDEHAVVVSEDGSVESVSLSTGSVRWRTSRDAITRERGYARVDGLCWRTPRGIDFVALSNGILRRLSGDTGRVLWQVDVTQGSHKSLSGLCRVGDQIGLFASPSTSKDSTAQLYQLDADSGAPSSPTLSTDVSPTSTDFLAMPFAEGPGLVWLNGGKLWATTVRNGALSTPEVFQKGGTSFIRLVDVGLMERGVVVAQRRDGSAVTVMWLQGQYSRLGEFSDAAVDVHFSGYSDRVGDSHIARLSYSSSLQLGNLQVISTSSNASNPPHMLTGHTFPYNLEMSGPMTSFAIQVSRREAYSVATRALVGTSTGQIQLWYGSKQLWTREEGLASVDMLPTFVSSSSLFVASGAVSPDMSHTLYTRLQRQMGIAVGQTVPSISVAGHFVIGSSRAGVVYSVSNGGQLLWRTRALASPGRTLDWFSVVGLPGSSQGGEATIEASARVVDTITGERRGIRIFTIDASTGQVIGEESRAAGSTLACGSVNHLDPLCASQIVQGEGQVIGQGLSGSNWTFSLPRDHTVVSVIPQTLGQVASLGRVLGNRSTLLKYLNPNLVVVVSISTASTSASIYLVDTTTGVLVYAVDQIPQVDGSSNVRVLLQDNWLLYSYRLSGDVAQTTQIVSIELYHTTAAQSSPYSIAGIDSLSRTYVSSLGLSLLGTTTTALGITSYSALFVSDAGQLVAVPRRFLDPRRPYAKLTKDDQEEMLLPYDPVLPVDSRWIVSSNYDTLGLNRVVSLPGYRESESLVLAYGLDLFATRLSPSRSFDVLSPAFNKLQLLVTVTGLTAALVATRSMVKVGRLRQKWYTI